MTTYFRRETTCGRCGGASEHEALGSTNAFGSADLDLRPPPMQRSTMGAWLEECPHCHLVAANLNAPDGDPTLVESAEYRAVLADPDYPPLARRFLAHAVLRVAAPADAGYDRLCAAWVCDDAGQPKQAATCRLAAADGLATARLYDDGDAGFTRGAVLVDVLRRGGRLDSAAAVCDRLLATTGLDGLVRKVIEAQSRMIAAGDRNRYTVADVSGG